MKALENGRASRFRTGRLRKDDCPWCVQGVLERSLLPVPLGGACSPAREPRTGAGGLCLPAAGRWQAQIDPRGYSENELTARPAYLCCSFRGG